MNTISKHILLLFLLGSFSLFTSCGKDNDIAPTEYGIFSSQDETTAIIDGVIDSDTPTHWDNFIAAFPNTNELIMKDCPGSTDDAANLKASRKIRQQGVAIHLPADAEIASGAVDLFLAGITRTREAGSKIGVHSWSDRKNSATDFPEGHEEHQIYIDYYLEMGFSQNEAEAFYYFTINAASADDMHWMTDSEIEKYGLLTN